MSNALLDANNDSPHDITNIVNSIGPDLYSIESSMLGSEMCLRYQIDDKFFEIHQIVKNQEGEIISWNYRCGNITLRIWND